MDVGNKEDKSVLLVVEDDTAMRSLLCDELYELGLRIIEAGDGHEALELMAEHKPGVILTDLRMPAGGLDHVARLKVMAPECPIILMTAFGDAATKTQALKAGVAAYFDKPVRMGDLREKIKQLLHLDGQDAAKPGDQRK